LYENVRDPKRKKELYEEKAWKASRTNNNNNYESEGGPLLDSQHLE